MLSGTELELPINRKDLEGNTPLHLAARSHAHLEFVSLLVSQGADRLIQNNAHETPYDVAQNTQCNRNECHHCDELKEYLSQPQKALKRIEAIIKPLKGQEK